MKTCKLLAIVVYFHTVMWLKRVERLNYGARLVAEELP